MYLPSITVVGAGAWGTTVAHLLANNCECVYLWASQESLADQIRQTGYNEAYLPGVRLHPNIRAVHSVQSGLLDSRLVAWAIPVQFLRSRLRTFTRALREDVICVNLGKGIEEETLSMPSAILAQECTSYSAVGSLFGPTIAAEVAAGLYTEATLGLSDPGLLELVAAQFTTPTFRVHLTTNIDGIEVRAALKNVCAIAAGLCDGLGLGANTKSLVIAASLEEMRLLGSALGTEPCQHISRCTAADILTSCYSEGGRNRRMGEYLGQGHTLPESLAMLGGRIAEGLATCRACFTLRQKLALDLPIIENLHAVLDGQMEALTCVRRILAHHSAKEACEANSAML